jgi:hypothetical protein
MSDEEAFGRLQELLEDLRAECRTAGCTDELEALIERYRAAGIWPFE